MVNRGTGYEMKFHSNPLQSLTSSVCSSPLSARSRYRGNENAEIRQCRYRYHAKSSIICRLRLRERHKTIGLIGKNNSSARPANVLHFADTFLCCSRLDNEMKNDQF